MDEERSNSPAPAAPSAARRSKAPLTVLLILVLAVAAAGIYMLTRKPATIDPAVYMPKDVAMAMTIDMSKSADRDAAMSYLEGVLKDAGVKDPGKDLFKELSKSLSMDLEKDVLPHLNGQGGLAVGTELNGMAPKVVLVFGTRGSSHSTDLMNVVTNKITSLGAQATKANYKGYQYQRINVQMQAVCIGAVDNAVLCVLGEDAFRAAIDKSKGKDNLAGNQYFAKYRQADPSNVMTMFVSGPGISKLVRPILGLALMQAGPEAGRSADQALKGLEAATAVAINLGAKADGLTFRVQGLSSKKGPAIKTASLDDMMARIPRDAIFAGSVPGIDQYWPQFQKSLQSDPTVAAQFAQTVGQVKKMIGVDLLTDVIPYIRSADAYLVSKPSEKASDMRGHFALRIGFEKQSKLPEALKKIEKAIATFAKATPKQTKIAGRSVTMFSSPAGTICDTILDDQVLVVVADSDIPGEIKSAIDLANSKGPMLTSSKQYQMVAERLPKQALVGFFLNLQPVAKNAPKKELQGKERKQFAAIVDKIGVAGGAVNASGNESDYIMVVPFNR